MTIPLFEQIKAEHRKILRQLELLPAPENSKEHIAFLWDFAEVAHHEKEEILLFSEVFKVARHREGGPMCSYFFDSQMNNPPEEKVARLLKKLAPLTAIDVPIEPHQKEVFDANSPIKIPINEHRSGKALLRYCQLHLDEEPFEKIAACLELYKEIQIAHINKEETCFFHMCSTILNPETLEKIHRSWGL